MATLRFSKLLRYGIIGGLAGGTALSMHNNQYQLDSVGIVRLSRAAYAVFQIGKIYKRELYSKEWDVLSSEYKQMKSHCHQLGAEKLLQLCCSNKGVYIKVGQHIAALDYLLPPEYVQTMKVLHSHAPTSDVQDIYRVIKEDLRQDPHELFAEISPEPIGSASLAQVHKATMKDGSVVAVKVQHPAVLGNSRVDMKTMEYLVRIVAFIFPEFKFLWLVNESKRNIPIELDFSIEGHNAEKIQSLFKDVPWLKIPKIMWEFSSKRVLTMEYVEGGQVNDVNYIKENKINPFEVSDKLGRLYSEMIFIHGFVHSDPHPGNILVKKSAKGHCDIILLDHGLYATLNRDVMVEYANLWLSILNRDKEAMRHHTTNLGITGDLYGIFACMITGRSWESVMGGIENSKISVKEMETVQERVPKMVPKIIDVLDKVNRQLLLIFKTNDLMRGIDHTLKTDSRMGSFRVMSQCCVESVYSKKIDSSNSKVQRFKYNVVKLWTLFKIRVYYTFASVKQISLGVFGWQ